MFEIGNSLREARLRRELDFPELEQGTKIRAKYLRALEDETFDQLPAPTYVKGFLRTYADYLGLDGQLYVDEYNVRYGSGDEVLERRIRAGSTTPRRAARPAPAARVEGRLAHARRDRRRHGARDRRVAVRRQRPADAPAQHGLPTSRARAPSGLLVRRGRDRARS